MQQGEQDQPAQKKDSSHTMSDRDGRAERKISLPYQGVQPVKLFQLGSSVGAHLQQSTPATGSTTVPTAQAPLRCEVCARQFHSVRDQESHLASRSHLELLGAWNRGSAFCAHFAYELTSAALDILPHTIPDARSLDYGQLQYAQQWNGRMLSPEMQEKNDQLRLSLAAYQFRGLQGRFLQALDGGLTSVLEFVHDSGRDGLSVEDIDAMTNQPEPSEDPFGNESEEIDPDDDVDDGMSDFDESNY